MNIPIRMVRAASQSSMEINMTITARELKPGTLIRYRSEPFIVLQAKYLRPGNGAGYVDTKLQMIKDGRVIKKIFAPSAPIETVEKNSQKAKYLSHANGSCLFRLADGREVSVPERLCGKAIPFLPSGAESILHYYDGNLLEVSLPQAACLLVEQIIDGCAWVETGVPIKVPSFIKKGNKIVVKTADGSFLYRADE